VVKFDVTANQFEKVDIFDPERAPSPVDFHQAVLVQYEGPQMIVIGGCEEFGKTNAMFRLRLPETSVLERFCLQDDYRRLCYLDQTALD
jgi:hypothetical protein